ncbi:Mitochondrial ATPase complex subunit atp10 [Massospora cicadina]|nr:Mitochondrial ATPase complex subunit atp10 [Massospora cicadina]
MGTKLSSGRFLTFPGIPHPDFKLTLASLTQLRRYSETPPPPAIKGEPKLGPLPERRFNASISVEDKRLSPSNLSIRRKLRLNQLRELKGFIPGDIHPPVAADRLDIRCKLDRKVEDALEERRLHRRQVLRQVYRKFCTPHYQDFHGKLHACPNRWKDVRLTDGKLFEANEREVPEQHALYMPNMQLVPLSPHLEKFKAGQSKVELMDQLAGKLTLVTFYLTQYGEAQCRSFVSPFQALVGVKPPDLQLVEINVAERFFNGLLLRLFAWRIRSQLPEARQANYYLRYGSLEAIREKLAMVNALIGYVFLVDRDLKVRWYANGEATPKEIEAMTAIVARLSGVEVKVRVDQSPGLASQGPP